MHFNKYMFFIFNVCSAEQKQLHDNYILILKLSTGTHNLKTYDFFYNRIIEISNICKSNNYIVMRLCREELDINYCKI